MKQKTQIIIALLLLGLLSSCSIERKLAREFVQSNNKGAVLIFSPEYVFKKSLKEEEIENPEQYTEDQLDSVLFYRSQFLQSLDDSIFLVKLVNQYIDDLKAFGFDIYTQDYIDLFMEKDTNSWVINMAQIEVEEYTYPYEFEEMVGYETYAVSIDLDALNCNAWFEINPVNKPERQKVLFATHYIMDDLYGQFRQNVLSGKVKFEYSIDSLYIKDIYEFAEVLGAEYAHYTLNYLMNKFIDEQIIDENYKPEYLQYDPASRQFYKDPEDGFEVME
ncbi:MAG: hypothetical protein U5Q03_05800 [Bacteroidota bacterium]|nr:hypothetical protein [Bacteroidota bacterium]